MLKRLILLGAIAALAACDSASGASGNVCNTQAIPQLTLVNPAPGTTGVPDSTAALLFSGTLYTQEGPPSIKLTTSDGVAQTLTTFNSTSGGYIVPLPSLSTSTTYSVTYVVQLIASGTQSPCSQTTSISEGSFTTQ